MNTKQTWWLTGAAIALFLFIVVFERRESPDAAAERTSTALIPGLRRDLITAVEIVEPGKPAIRMTKTGQFWMMEAPVHYPATVEPWLHLLERATWIIRLAPEELANQGDDLADFGLNPARVRIVLQLGDKKTELLLGDSIPVGDRLYAQVGGQDGVMITDALLISALPESVNAWRNPALLSFGSRVEKNGQFSFGRVEIRSTNHGFSLRPDPDTGGWRLIEPIDARADGAMVGTLLYAMAPGWRVEEYITDNVDADVEAYGLKPPVMELAYMKGSNEVLSVQFGGSPTNRPDMVYARQVQFTNVVLTARTNIEVLQLPYTYWRDRRLISLDTNRVAEITADYAFGDNVFSYRLVSDTNHLWRIVEPEHLPADSGLVHEFFTQMNQLRVTAFEKDVVTDFAEYGLAVPARQFAFGINTNLANTNGYPALSFGTNENDQAFARRSDEIKVYSISPGSFADLPLAHWQWRDREIWSFETNQVKRVIIEQHGKKREVIRTDEGGWLLAPGSTGVLDLSFDEAVFRLSKLAADRWVAKGGGGASDAQFGFLDDPHRVSFEVKKNGVTSTNTVTFGGFRDGILPFARVALDDDVTWYFDFPPSLYYPFAERNFALPKGE